MLGAEPEFTSQLIACTTQDIVQLWELAIHCIDDLLRLCAVTESKLRLGLAEPYDRLR